jgi:hypothetical protein
MNERIKIGYAWASPALVKFVRSKATNDFMELQKLTSREFGTVIEYPEISGYDKLGSHCHPVAMKGPNFPPHVDPRIIAGNRPWRAFFWVLDTSESEQEVHLQVGNRCIGLRKGDYAIFDAELMHSAQSSRVWYGIGAQFEIVK